MATDATASSKTIAEQGHAIGTVQAAVGLVKAVDENGVERTLQVGDLVYPNDTIETAANAGIIIHFDSGGFVDLPPSTDLVLNDEIYEAARQVAEDEALRVQRAIEAGEDPSVAAAAAATGASGDEGAATPLVIGFADTQATVESGGVQTTPLVEPISPPAVPSALLVNASAVALGLLNISPVDASERIVASINSHVSGNVLANASDANGNLLSVVQFTVAGIVHVAGQVADIAGVGSVVIQGDGSFAFTPVTNFVGSIPEVTYVVSDNHGGTTSSTLDIAVTQTAQASPFSIQSLAEASLQSLSGFDAGGGMTKGEASTGAMIATTTQGNVASNEILKVGDLLDSPSSSKLAEGGYLKFNYDEGSGSTKITIDSNGAAAGGKSQVIVLENVDLTAHNTLSTATIIHNLLQESHSKAEA